jgi:hypothetical protein
VGSHTRADARRRLTDLWEDLRLDTPSFLPRQVRRDLAYLGLPGFYVPRADVWTFPTWTYVYEPSLLPSTLERHVDFAALNASATMFAVTAVDVEAGILTRFRNRGVSHTNKDSVRNPETDERVEIRPRHILASASLAPAFPWTEIDGRKYWDGGLVDNTPLGDAIDAFSDRPAVERLLVVMNMYPLRARLPRNLVEVHDRVHELEYGNRMRQDGATAKRVNDLVATIEALTARVPAGALTGDLKARVDRALQFKVIKVIDIDMQDPSDQEPVLQDPADNEDGLRDFSPPTIERRRAHGYALAMRRLAPVLP